LKKVRIGGDSVDGADFFRQKTSSIEMIFKSSAVLDRVFEMLSNVPVKMAKLFKMAAFQFAPVLTSINSKVNNNIMKISKPSKRWRYADGATYVILSISVCF
jgi:hypothetical protein